MLPTGYTTCDGSTEGVAYTWPYPEVGYWGETPDGDKTDLYTCLPINVWNNGSCHLIGSGSYDIRMTWVNAQGQPTAVGCPDSVQVRLWSYAGFTWIKDYPPYYSLGTPMGNASGDGDNGMGDPFVVDTVVGSQYMVRGASEGARILRRHPQGGVITLTVFQSFNASVSNYGNMGRFAATGAGGATLDVRDLSITPGAGVTYHAEAAPAPSAVIWDGESLTKYLAVPNPLPHAGETGYADIGLGLVTNAAVLLPEQYKIKYGYTPTRIGPGPTQENQHPYAWTTSFTAGSGTYRSSGVGPLSGSLIDYNGPSPYDIPGMFTTYIHPYVMDWGLAGFYTTDGHAGQTDDVSLKYTWTEDKTSADAKLQVRLHKELEDKHFYKTLPDTSYAMETFATEPEWTPPASTLPSGHPVPEGTFYEAPLWNSVFVDDLRATLATAALVVPAGRLVTAMKLLGIALPLVAPKEKKEYVPLPSQSDFNNALADGRVEAGCADITDSSWKASRRTWYDSDLNRALAYGSTGYLGMARMGIERRNRREWLYAFCAWSTPGDPQ